MTSKLKLFYYTLYNWAFETTAFILLPLIIYFIMFISLGIQISEFVKLPEWMFISIILYGDTLRKNINYSKKNVSDFEKASTFFISIAIIGITISSVLLAFSIIVKYKEFELSSVYYQFETFVFFFAIIFSVVTEIINKMNIDTYFIKKSD